MARSNTDVHRLVEAYVEMWNTRNYTEIPGLVSDSFVLFEPAVPDGQVQGSDGLEEFLRYIVSAFPDFEVRHIDSLSDEDTVMVETEYTLTHEGTFEEISPTGKNITIRGMEKIVVESGKIQEHRLYYDLQEFFDQLGVEK